MEIQNAKITQNIAVCAPSHKFVELCFLQWGMNRQSAKKLLKQQYLLQMSPQYGELRPTNGWDRFGRWGTPTNNGYASSLHYCSDFAHWRPTKPCMTFGRLLGWYTIKYIYIFGSCCPWRNFARYKIYFASKSCILLYSQRYCTALNQRASAKFWGMLQGM